MQQKTKSVQKHIGKGLKTFTDVTKCVKLTENLTFHRISWKGMFFTEDVMINFTESVTAGKL